MGPADLHPRCCPYTKRSMQCKPVECKMQDHLARAKLPQAGGVSDRGSKRATRSTKIVKPIVLSLAVSCCAPPVLAQSDKADPKIGDAPPAFGLEKVLQAPEGKKVGWAALRGKVVALELWATWCGPCVGAIPHLNELADKFKDEPVQFIAVTGEDEKVIVPFLKRKAARRPSSKMFQIPRPRCR